MADVPTHYDNPRNLLLIELDLLAQQGRPAELIEKYRGEILALSNEELDINHYWHQLGLLRPVASWPYIEPSDYAEILATLSEPQQLPPLNRDHYFNKLHGGVLGRCAGMMLGKPLEGMQSAANMRRYLEHANAYPLTDYVPRLDYKPDDVFFNPIFNHWERGTRGNITRTLQDDDIEYVVAAYHILKTYGQDFTTADVGQFWLSHFAFGQVHTAERIVYRHLVNGLPANETGSYRNPFREFIGAQIRADVYGYISPGQPRRAAELAYRDAALSHTKNGIYGAMWAAAIVSAAFVLGEPAEVIRAGLAEIPPRSRLHEAVSDVLEWSELDSDWEQTLSRIQEKHGAYYSADERFGWVHTIPNACLVALGILHGKLVFGKSIAITVMGGWDTDSSGATTGSVAGVMQGKDSLPGQWTDPLNDTLESYIPGYGLMKISALAQKIYALTD